MKEKKLKSRKGKLIIVDGSNLAFRAYMKFQKLKNSSGDNVGLIYGFLRILSQYITRFRCSYVIVSFDTKASKDSNFKKALLPEYKIHRAHRKKINIDYEDFNKQLRSVKKCLKYLGVPVIWDKKGLGHEADDYIAKIAIEHKDLVLIISSDKDFCQLIDSRIKVFNPFKNKTLSNGTCRGVMGYTPQECVDYLTLVGDSSDDIPGYSGIGPVKARKFLDEFGSIQNFLKSRDNTFAGIDYDALEYIKGRNFKLIDLKSCFNEHPVKKIPMIVSKGIDKKKLKLIFTKYQFKSFLTEDFLKPFKRLKLWE